MIRIPDNIITSVSTIHNSEPHTYWIDKKHANVWKGIFLIWVVRLLVLRPLLAYCASLG
jgi:hypothetical protein